MVCLPGLMRGQPTSWHCWLYSAAMTTEDQTAPPAPARSTGRVAGIVALVAGVVVAVYGVLFFVVDAVADWGYRFTPFQIGFVVFVGCAVLAFVSRGARPLAVVGALAALIPVALVVVAVGNSAG